MIAVILFILCVSLGFSFSLIFRLLPLRNTQSVTALILADFAMAIWIIGYLMEILAPDLAVKLFWAKVQYVGIVSIPVVFLFFVLQYSGLITRIGIIHILALSLIPVLTLLIAATNEMHGWLWQSAQLSSGEAFMAPLELTHGWWFGVHTLYSYILLLSATTALIVFARRARDPFRSQAIIMIVGLLAPWLLNALYILNIHLEPGLDLTPIAFTFTNGLITLGFLRFGLLDILPIAHATIFKSMIDGVIILDLKDRVIDANPAARRIFQETVGKLRIGEVIQPLLPEWPNHSPMEISRSEVTLGTGSDRKIYALQISPITNNQGRATGQMALFTEITELKNTQSQMVLQAKALNSAENGIMITNAQGDIEWVNPAFSRLTGYSFSEVVGQNARILKSGKHPPAFYQNLWSSLRIGKVWRGEMINRHKDGSLYFEEMTLTPLLDAQGETAHFIAIKQDISERKEAEEALRLAHAEVLEASMLKTQLLANVSHDLRTPLSAIVGFAEMLNAGIYGNVNLQQTKVLEDILDSSHQLLLFVNNLIDRAQIDVGKIVFKPNRFQISELVEAAEFSISSIADRKGIQVDYEVDLSLPNTLCGDIYWLRQIVLNLMVNAVKFTDQGSVRFRLEKQGIDSWAIVVSDTGIGIPFDAREKIFEPFQQVDGSETRSRTGSGLGLSIVKELVTLMGGRILLESEIGGGSCFTVILPLN